MAGASCFLTAISTAAAKQADADSASSVASRILPSTNLLQQLHLGLITQPGRLGIRSMVKHWWGWAILIELVSVIKRIWSNMAGIALMGGRAEYVFVRKVACINIIACTIHPVSSTLYCGNTILSTNKKKKIGSLSVYAAFFFGRGMARASIVTVVNFRN